jgi:hypothetical protein
MERLRFFKAVKTTVYPIDAASNFLIDKWQLHNFQLLNSKTTLREMPAASRRHYASTVDVFAKGRIGPNQER